jgi:hypothetical protein
VLLPSRICRLAVRVRKEEPVTTEAVDKIIEAGMVGFGHNADGKKKITQLGEDNDPDLELNPGKHVPWRTRAS